MSLPGFDAELSLGSSARRYGGSVSGHQRSDFNVRPALERESQCTTEYSGFVTYPMRVCEFPHSQMLSNVVGLAGVRTRAFGSAQFLRAEPTPGFCRTHHGPWLAEIVQQQHCDFREPDDFTLTIKGGPQPVELSWKGTLHDAPTIVGALGNVFPSVPTCSCCGSRKQCPDGSCVPPSSPCGPISPA
jgi:hypothetical protein